MKKNIALRRGLIVALITVVFAGMTVVSSAYFSDYETASGRAVIHLAGQTEINEEVTGTEKTVSIVNTGEVPVFVRVAIYGPDEMVVNPASEWKDGGDGFWYYASILPEGERTSTITASIDNMTEGDVANSEFDIIVVHESVPAAFESDGKTVKTPDGWAKWAVE